jgi:hypothetical protein
MSQTEPIGNEATPPKKSRWWWVERVVFDLTGLGTLALAFLAFLQWQVLHHTDMKIGDQIKVMEKQLTVMQTNAESTSKLITANEKLAEASVKSAQVAEDNFKLAKIHVRANVAPQPPRVFNVNAGGSPLIAYVRLENTGQTRARNVQRSVGISLDQPSKDLREAVVEPGSLSINAREIAPFVERSLRTLTPDESAAIKSSSKKIYVFGWYRFQDAFHELHEETYCFEYFGAGSNEMVGYGYPGATARACTLQ